MAADIANVAQGMDVFDSTGDRIGTVDDVLRTPGQQDGMSAYREAATANVGTDADTDDADAEAYTTATGNSGDSLWNSTVEDAQPLTGNAVDRGSSAQGTGAAPGAGGLFPMDRGDNGVMGSNQGGSPALEAAGESGYVVVKSGGILGMGATTLYVPSNAIDTVVAGDNITLSCTKDEAENQFTNAPSNVDMPTGG